MSAVDILDPSIVSPCLNCRQGNNLENIKKNMSSMRLLVLIRISNAKTAWRKHELELEKCIRETNGQNACAKKKEADSLEVHYLDSKQQGFEYKGVRIHNQTLANNNLVIEPHDHA